MATEQILPLNELTEQVLEESGYLEMLKNDSSAEAPGRLENLRELVSVMSDVATYPNLREFLEHVSLIMDNDSAIDNNKVMLITLHSAKGLEFDTVFLPGWEENLFPHQKSLDEGGTNSLEEERRLAYVAITRAKRRLYITLAHSRRLYGEWQNNFPSRFINEIPTACLQITNQSSHCYGGGSYGYGCAKNYRQKPTFNTKPSYQRYTTYDEDHEYSYEPTEYADYDSYQSGRTSSLVGLRVYHESFGYGSIISVEGQICVVDFDDFGRKKVMGTYLSRA